MKRSHAVLKMLLQKVLGMTYFIAKYGKANQLFMERGALTYFILSSLRATLGA